METSSISLDLTKRSFTISGSEEFVSARLAQMLELVSTATSPSIPSSEPKTIMPDSFDRDDASLKDQCETAGIFYLDQETGLPVLQERVPGENKREKMRNVALLLLYGAEKPIEAAYIKEQCRRQSCLDTGNFSKAYEMDKRNFIKKGKAGSRDWTLELTIPGIKTAESLIQAILESLSE